MNSVFIMGGLGNQLFGYVFAKHLERCGEVGLDLGWFNSPDNHTDRFPTREFLLDKFTTEYKLAVPGRRSTVHEDYYDKTKGYGNGFFWGYWQKASYYMDLNLNLKLKDEYITQQMINVAMAMKMTASVAVHVRRTDYAQFDNWMLDMDYYKKAAEIMEERIKEKPKFVVFSDDIDWCRENIPFKAESFLHGDELMDFWLMSQCKHNIIANSTYSFWAAMLNDNPNKVVIYPEDWKCGQRPVDTKIEGWIGV